MPTSTYRLQLGPLFGFREAAEVVDHLAELGVSHLYCSPVLQAAPGSAHGYDVVDHSRLSDDLGGAPGFDALVAAARAVGLGVVVDVVPNHMAVPVPESLNAAWWSMLREGPSSPYAHWFDVDWTAQGGRVLLPVLGSPLGEVVEAGDLAVDSSGDEPVLRYHTHAFPLADGTADLPLEALVDRQHYRLAFWRVGAEELNYRRFFDVTTLAGVRVEQPDVCEATHGVLLDRVRAGDVDGVRVDHPDGLADPRGYLHRLAEQTGGAWVVVEKILEGHETLPADWPCAGTTGYEALRTIGGVLVDPAGEQPLTDLYTALTGDTADFATVAEESKRLVVSDVLGAEVTRLTRLARDICAGELRWRDFTVRGLREALVELLVALDVYRAYVVPGEPAPEEAVETVRRAATAARSRLLPRTAEIDLLADLALGGHGGDGVRGEYVRRFAQTCGAVMAKGVEDTAFYRYTRFVMLNEVGGDPGRFGASVAELHEANAARQRDWPDAMTTLSTHDTKRSEDVRARLAVLSEIPREWSQAVTSWRAAASHHRSTTSPRTTAHHAPGAEYLFWQTLVGAWPVDASRLTAYLEKATREAKTHTSWTDPDEEFDAALRRGTQALLADPGLMASVASFVARIRPHAAANVLAQKLVQLTSPGVPDVYQGTEVEALALVDPDNRRPVDVPRLRSLVSDQVVDPDLPDPVTDLDAAKARVTARALRLRRTHPEWFGRAGTYEPLHAAGEAAGHVVAFARSGPTGGAGTTGRAVTVAPRLTAVLAREGGWRDTTLTLTGAAWTDVLTGATYAGGTLEVARLLDGLGVALLVPTGG
ncbi:MAG: malto-oligosyltrehalose synthase [Actinomycetes bacterium]